MPAQPPGQGKKIAGLDPLLFWGLVGAAGVGAVYFLLRRQTASRQQPAAGTGAASGPGLISADGAPILYPLGSGQAGSGSVVTSSSGGGTGSGGSIGRKLGGGGTGPPTRHPHPIQGRRPKGQAGSSGIVTMAAMMPAGNAQAGSGGGWSAPPSVSPLGSGPYSYAQLEGLWIQAGGSRATAPVAAAVAMAESGGRPGVPNAQGSGALGLWQILGAPTGWKGSTNWANPQVNARAAVAKYKAAGGWSPWATYPQPALSMVRTGVRPVLPGPAHAAGAHFPGVTTPGFVWPFLTKSPSQFRRVDQGWDLQYAGTRPTPVLAVAPGKVVQLGPDPSGFGNAYPGLILSKPRAGVGEVYYGHTFLAPGIAGKTVKQGQVIGYTGGPTSGGDAAGTPNWLEIGIIGPGGSYPAMGAGSRIKNLLLHAPTAASVKRGKTVQAAPTHQVHLPAVPKLRQPQTSPRRAAPKPRRAAPLRNAGRRVR